MASARTVGASRGHKERRIVKERLKKVRIGLIKVRGSSRWPRRGRLPQQKTSTKSGETSGASSRSCEGSGCLGEVRRGFKWPRRGQVAVQVVSRGLGKKLR